MMSRHLALGVALCAGGLWAQPDPTHPGPLAVASKDYKIAAVPLPTVSYPIDIWGTVWYPEDLAGGPFPFVLMLHGNHGICRLPNTQTDLGTTTYPPNCPANQIQTPNHSGY